MLPGKARSVPIPRKLRMSDAINAAASPHHGPTSTAHKTLTKCCTGAHLDPNTGKENKLPTTATAAKIAVSVIFLMFVLFILSSLSFSVQEDRKSYFCFCTAFITAFTIRQRTIVITISGKVFPTGVSTLISTR